MNDDNKDQQLWRIAQKRANFRRSFISYVIVNFFLWVLWWFTSGRVTGFSGHPWPVWVMLGWGISIALHYFEAYTGSKSDLAEREYEKLKRQNKL